MSAVLAREPAITVRLLVALMIAAATPPLLAIPELKGLGWILLGLAAVVPATLYKTDFGKHMLLLVSMLVLLGLVPIDTTACSYGARHPVNAAETILIRLVSNLVRDMPRWPLVTSSPSVRRPAPTVSNLVAVGTHDKHLPCTQNVMCEGGAVDWAAPPSCASQSEAHLASSRGEILWPMKSQPAVPVVGSLVRVDNCRCSFLLTELGFRWPPINHHVRCPSRWAAHPGDANCD